MTAALAHASVLALLAIVAGYTILVVHVRAASAATIQVVLNPLVTRRRIRGGVIRVGALPIRVTRSRPA